MMWGGTRGVQEQLLATPVRLYEARALDGIVPPHHPRAFPGSHDWLGWSDQQPSCSSSSAKRLSSTWCGEASFIEPSARTAACLVRSNGRAVAHPSIVT